MAPARAQGYAWRLIPAPLLPLFPRPTTARQGKAFRPGSGLGTVLGWGRRYASASQSGVR